MKAKAFICAASLGIGLLAASTASAGESGAAKELARRGYDRHVDDRYERGGYRYERGRYEPGRYERGRYEPGRYERGRHYHERYVVKYHLHGERRLHARDDGHAHWVVDMLRRSGVHAELRGHCDVVYHMHGEGRRAFVSHEEAHRFERSLCDLGFDVKVIE